MENTCVHFVYLLCGEGTTAFDNRLYQENVEQLCAHLPLEKNNSFSNNLFVILNLFFSFPVLESKESAKKGYP